MTERPTDTGTPLSVRFLVYYAVAYLLLIGLTGLVFDRSTRATLESQTQHDLEVVADLAQSTLPARPDGYGAWAEDIFEASGFRVTLIRADGAVLADSHHEPASMENHAGRPEVMEALDGQVGTSTRMSASTGAEQLYLALPVEGDLIVRTSVTTRRIETELSSVRTSTVLTLVIAGLIGVAFVAYLARRLTRPIAELTEQSLAVASGRLDVSPRRTSVRELDQLGTAISSIASELGTRVEEAERANEYLEVVLGALAQGTVLIDGQDRVAYANPAAESLLGSVPEDLSNLSPYQCQVVVREARESGEAEERVIEVGKPIRRIRSVATPFPDDDRILLVVVDITAEERVAAVRRDFVANASHELKTPVTTIIASAEALKIAVDRGDKSAIAFSDQIEASARQLDGLVSDLLDLSRLERETPELGPVRLDLLVNDELERLGSEAAAKDVSLGSELAEMVVAASHRDLAIAVRNLLDNAIRYTDTGGSIQVSAYRDEGMGVVEVSDTGEGIPTRDLDRVFERFYRVDSGRSRATGGTGLGLSIVRHVADSHGGGVDVESELGVGSTFTVRIPLFEGGSTTTSN